jgi:adenylylsulfate kinase-like enzyme
MKKKLIKNKGILFWITGLAGSGKTSLAIKIHKKIDKLYGPTIYFSGDQIRKIFNLKGYGINERTKIGYMYSNLFRFITNQNINVIFAGIVLIDKIRGWNKKNIKNYVEIYIDAKIKNIMANNKKSLYKKKFNNIVGINIKPDIPKKPDITIVNNFSKSLNSLSKILIKKIITKYNFNNKFKKNSN